MPDDVGASVLARCRELGFAGAGVCRADASAFGDAFRDWISEGRHGSMAWLEANSDLRLDVARLIDADRPAASVVMVADLYTSRADAPTPLPSGHGRVARYAHGKDYHKVIKRRLHTLCDELAVQFPGEVFRAFVDTAPVLERELAARCGLGWTGKHTLTIHPKLGSYTLLGGIATTLPMDPPLESAPMPDHCGTCTRCIDACPTDAITPYSVDASRCVSYLTIEHRNVVDASFHEAMGDWLFGCDVCQEVCPHNSHREASPANAAYQSDRASFDLFEVLGWTADDRSRALTGSAMKRATLEMFRRNAVIVLGNLGSAEAVAAIRSVAQDVEEAHLVRRTAQQVLKRLDGSDPNPR